MNSAIFYFGNGIIYYTFIFGQSADMKNFARSRPTPILNAR